MTWEFGILQVSEPNHLKAIENALASKGTFVDITDILSLDKTTDFKWANLQGVDFTNSDLRGFDFTGADLRGSHGVNLTYDETTRLDNADVEGSLFGYIALERSIRQRDVDFDREYDLLKNLYWSDQLPYVTDRIKSSSDRRDIQLMAMRLFIEVKDNVVRGDMIRALNFSGVDRDDYLSFLLYVCATRREPVVLVAAIDALSAFRHHRSVFDTLLALTSHESEMVKVAAWEKLVRSRYLEGARDVIAQKLSTSASPLIRQRIAKGLAPTVGAYGRAIMAYQPFSRALGSKDLLTRSDFLDVASHVGSSDPTVFRHVENEARVLTELLIDLGVPIKIMETDRKRSGIVYVEPRPKGRYEGERIDDYVVEDYADHVLVTTKTQHEAIRWATENGLHPLVTRVRHLNDKSKPDYWRSVKPAAGEDVSP